MVIPKFFFLNSNLPWRRDFSGDNILQKILSFLCNIFPWCRYFSIISHFSFIKQVYSYLRNSRNTHVRKNIWYLLFLRHFKFQNTHIFIFFSYTLKKIPSFIYLIAWRTPISLSSKISHYIFSTIKSIWEFFYSISDYFFQSY